MPCFEGGMIACTCMVPHPRKTMVWNHGLHPLRTMVLKSPSATTSMLFSIARCQGGDFQDHGSEGEQTMVQNHGFVSGLQKGPAERGRVKKRQKSSKSVKKFFDNFRAGQKTSKIVKKCQKVFRHFSTIFARHTFFRPLLQSADFARVGPCRYRRSCLLRLLFSIRGISLLL